VELVKRTAGAAMLVLGLTVVTATAQDMMRYVDLSSPDMVSAEMTRADVETALRAARATTLALASAKLVAPIGLDEAKNFDKAKNRDRLIKQ
jgi:hypothetical protein